MKGKCKPRTSTSPAATHDIVDCESLDTQDGQGGEITAVKPCKGKADRVCVYVEGHLLCDLATEVAQTAGLGVGQSLTLQDIAKLQHEDEFYRAQVRALRLLATRARTIAEVGRHLQRLGFSPEISTDVVHWMQQRGYLDDREFAQQYASEKWAQGWGQRRIGAELARRGVARQLVTDAVDTLSEDAEQAAAQQEALLNLVRKRFARQFAADPARTERRVTGFLSRRGYDWEVIANVLRILREETASSSIQASNDT